MNWTASLMKEIYLCKTASERDITSTVDNDILIGVDAAFNISDVRSDRKRLIGTLHFHYTLSYLYRIIIGLRHVFQARGYLTHAVDPSTNTKG